MILAQQTNSSKKHVVIPTPENAINVPYYQKITTSMDKPPPRYIRLPGELVIVRSVYGGTPLIKDPQGGSLFIIMSHNDHFSWQWYI